MFVNGRGVNYWHNRKSSHQLISGNQGSSDKDDDGRNVMKNKNSDYTPSIYCIFRRDLEKSTDIG